MYMHDLYCLQTRTELLHSLACPACKGWLHTPTQQSTTHARLSWGIDPCVCVCVCVCVCLFVCVSPIQGLDALGYKEHIDYDLVESTNPAFGKAVVRVNVFRAHRQVSDQYSAHYAHTQCVKFRMCAGHTDS